MPSSGISRKASTTSFVQHYIQPLNVSPEISRPPTPAGPSSANSGQKEKLQALFASLNESSAGETLRDVANSFLETPAQGLAPDPEETILRTLIVRKLVVGLYTDALQLYLSEAVDAETEAEWWADIERSRWSIAYYLIQTLPPRLISVSNTILQGLRQHNVPFQLSTLSPSNLSKLFPSRDTFHPSALLTSFFPHIRKQKQPYQLTASTLFFVRRTRTCGQETIFARVSSAFAQSLQQIRLFISWPLELTRQEIHHKRKMLEKIRDNRAEALGNVAQIRTSLEQALQPDRDVAGGGSLTDVVNFLDRVLIGDHQISTDAYLPSPSDTPGIQGSLLLTEDHGSLVHKVAGLSGRTLQAHVHVHETEISTDQLRRPPRLTLIWPKLLLIPPIAVYGVYSLYASRASVEEFAVDASETVRGFMMGWVVEPIKDVLKTVRAGSAQSIVIQQEAVEADINSLERMVLSLAKDKLQYTPEQLGNLSHQIRAGDLTAVLKLYEEDIKSPFKSSVTGTLLRTLFIQIQKAKVDIDQALSGIDKLLKSQELTFAFVGIAPALGIVYLASSYVSSVWSGGRGRGRYGGKHRRAQAWAAMRRIERLLTSRPQPASASQYHQLPRSPVSTIAHVGLEVPIHPITSGLLLLSVTRLREFGERHLPAKTRLRNGFLEDVEDLESPVLSRGEKVRVVDRMWRSWGQVLGWADVTQ